ncbi:MULTISPECIES: hypothetical protein [unclassified Tolypothrix]|uniref:hypothetical protein n=1 Tax=unclassified Tolypothrix TaxID=2649714 RepID=UPI0005EAB8B9|nr:MULTISPECIES: hypothetical protein [unclassified Tolypothrix]BAY94335.1 hypothetical protein NIES3275_63820 [Microchaete diplosiphon NIES-3275]EKF04084.1 hypothetical protein FDUTEX481_02911 [Tolypothrix sp. PCC 7601]MBE9086231.1 hypothetical protein [Tolypothrix sp. LEGE 11397]UYD28063.1 hypothetical protein HGR01_08485 [Tolypothrix sp. PCC 7712]UYD36067.1 hypothetical protein HG267_10140 [Tolypothrix sp. PCC 7601]
MAKIKDLQRNWLGASLTLVLLSATIAPAAAQSVIIINGGRQTHLDDSFGYGNQRYNHIRVNPVRGRTHWNNDYRYRQRTDYRYPTTTIYTYPQYRQNNIYPGLNTPSVVNPIFRNSTIRNPVFDRHPGYNQPFRRRSQVNILYPW